MRWVKKFKTGCDSIYDAQKLDVLQCHCKQMVEKLCDVVKSDARLTVHQIATRVGISAASVFRILKRNLKMRYISARWIFHLLSNKQKRVRLETAKALLKMFPKYSRKQFSDIFTGVHFFEPTRKINNKIWATKHCCHPPKNDKC